VSLRWQIRSGSAVSPRVSNTGTNPSAPGRHGIPLCLCLLTACTTITKAEDFSVAPEGEQGRLCDRCPPDPNLRHAPCPPTEGSGDGGVVFFAVRTMDFGYQPAGWVDGYHAGMDQDCSARPSGTPVTCSPRSQDTFVPLPEGIDNALAQSVLEPIDAQTPHSLRVGLLGSVEQGEGGMLLILDGWNRTANDPHVGARWMATKSTTDGKPPRWDGTDRWLAFATGWDAQLPGVPVTAYNVTSTAYVREGQLVWDIRGEETLRLFFQSRGAVLRLDLRDGVMMGKVEESSVGSVVRGGSFAGVWSLYDAERHAGSLAQLAGGCDAAVWCPLEDGVRDRLRIAPDMHVAGSDKGTSDACDAISVGIEVSLEQTGGVDDLAEAAELSMSCAGQAGPCP